jgi:hypothetical protein
MYKLFNVGRESNKTARRMNRRAPAKKRRPIRKPCSMIRHLSLVKRRRAANPTKKRRKNTVAFIADEVKNQTRKSNAKVCRQN